MAGSGVLTVGGIVSFVLGSLLLATSPESQAYLRSFETSTTFRVVEVVYRDEDLSQRIVAGKAHVGVKIPEDFSRKLDETDLVGGVLFHTTGGFVRDWVENRVGLRLGDVQRVLVAQGGSADSRWSP